MARAITRERLTWTFRPLVAASSSFSKRGGSETSIRRITSGSRGWRMVIGPMYVISAPAPDSTFAISKASSSELRERFQNWAPSYKRVCHMHTSGQRLYIRFANFLCYSSLMRRTSVELDDERLKQVQRVLHTSGVKDTIERAFDEVLRADLRRRLAERIRKGQGIDRGDEVLRASRRWET
jgi:Arc/MetJ family transcription regulator